MRSAAFLLVCVGLLASCGHGGDDDGAYNCGGPKEEALAGDEVNRETMAQAVASGGLSGVTLPNKYAWTITKGATDFVFKVDAAAYILIPNAQQ